MISYLDPGKGVEKILIRNNEFYLRIYLIPIGERRLRCNCSYWCWKSIYKDYMWRSSWSFHTGCIIVCVDFGEGGRNLCGNWELVSMLLQRAHHSIDVIANGKQYIPRIVVSYVQATGSVTGLAASLPRLRLQLGKAYQWGWCMIGTKIIVV